MTIMSMALAVVTLVVIAGSPWLLADYQLRKRRDRQDRMDTIRRKSAGEG